MPRYRIRNLDRYQARVDSTAVRWVKVWAKILDDPDMVGLPDGAWRLSIELVILALRDDSGEGEIDGDAKRLSWRLRRSVRQTHLDALERVGFLSRARASDPESDSEEEKRKEGNLKLHESNSELRVHMYIHPEQGFEECWKAYPHWERRSRKGECRDLWRHKKLAKHAKRVWRDVHERKAGEDWTRDDGRFVPGMQVYLRAIKDPDLDLPEPWEDEHAAPTGA